MATSLQAQQVTKPPRWILGAELGGVSATDRFGVGVGWKSGWSAAANLTYRVTSNLGIRGDATFAQNDLSGGSIPGEGRLNKVAYLGNAVWQAVGMTSERFHPYALAGLGEVRVHAKGIGLDLHALRGRRRAWLWVSPGPARPARRGAGLDVQVRSVRLQQAAE